MFQWPEFERKWETYFKDRDHRNEAQLVSDRELALYFKLDSTILIESAVKIMTLFLGIVRTKQESGNGVDATMQEYKDLYGETVENEGMVRSMMYYVAPTLVGRGNIDLNQGVVDVHTAHFTQAAQFLYDLFLNHMVDADNVLFRFHMWIRSLYIYTNFVEVFAKIQNVPRQPREPTETLPVEITMRALMNMKAPSRSPMHRILTIEQLDAYIARRALTRAVDAQATESSGSEEAQGRGPCQCQLEEAVGGRQLPPLTNVGGAACKILRLWTMNNILRLWADKILSRPGDQVLFSLSVV